MWFCGCQAASGSSFAIFLGALFASMFTREGVGILFVPRAPQHDVLR
ncbi:Hypothetical protein A7982_03901 [Minicystis rosea]|nr:Hypothetical protein A7982_03901 [Minicystis rosea]